MKLNLLSFILSTAYMDAPEPWQLGFQDPATPIALGIQDLHHDIFFFIVGTHSLLLIKYF